MKLTQEQLAALIAQVFANLIAAGKDPTAISTEDIVAELAVVLDNASEGDGAGEGEGSKAEGGEGDCGGAVSPELIAKIVDALKAVKSEGDAGGAEGAEPAAGGSEGKADPAAGGSEGKAATPAPAQRKYSSIFLGGSAAARTGGNSFKDRLERMSAPERRKTALGMFGRAVKCIHASGGTTILAPSFLRSSTIRP